MNEIVTLNPAAGRVRRPGSVRLVPFLFGVAGRDELPGVALVQLLEAIGLSRPGARGLIARMRIDGQLAATPRGRGCTYHMVGNFAAAYHRIRTGAAGLPAAWDGVFHTLLYRVPETERAFRDRLRRQAVFVGYGLLHQGVLICPTDRHEMLRPSLADAPEEAVVYSGRLELAAADAARAAREAWGLDDLNRRYRAHAERLRAAVSDVAGEPPASGETLAIFAELLSPALVDLLRSPALPVELFPPDWSLPDLRSGIDAVQQVFGAPAVAFAQQLLAAV